MKKMIALMFVLCAATMTTACIEDGPGLDCPDAGDDDVNPDAGSPDDPDARPDDPDASTSPLPTLNVTATPMTITVGQSTTVSWVSTNTTSCSSSGGGQTLNGSWEDLFPTATSTYTLTCSGPGGEVSDSVTVTVNPATSTPPVCHDMGLYFSNTQVSQIDVCKKYDSLGQPQLVAKGNIIWGGTGGCAMACYNSQGITVEPMAVTGVWTPGATVDVTRWYTSGCARLPDHPVGELDQAGGTWDGRCDRPVTTLADPPNTSQ